MPEEIVNRVAKSSLVTLDLEDFYPKGKRVVLDLKDWLFEEFVLKEKDFRLHVKTHDWSLYEGCYVALVCSTDAIIPAWAYMLVSINLKPYAKKIILGNLDQLESSIYQDIINNLDLNNYKDKPIIIKGCANKPVPVNAYIMLSNKLTSIAKSVMYGEACSSVPLFKKR